MKFPVSNDPLKINSKFILPLCMLFITVSLAADAVAYKFASIGPAIVSGATVIFPLTYLIGDVITEVYGYYVNKSLIWSALFCEILFALSVSFVSHMHILANFPYQNDFNHVFDKTIWFVSSGIIADLVSNFLNSMFISKWKISLKGKHFWVRSIVATLISQFIQAIIICPLAFWGVSSKMDVLKIMTSAYVVEIGYAFIFVWPACLLVYYLKKYDKFDAYDIGVSYNPIKFR